MNQRPPAPRAGRRNSENCTDVAFREPWVTWGCRPHSLATIRSLDHIGFEVKNLEEFCKKLEAAGQKFDRPYTRLPNSTTAIAFLTDPWGTYIELTENLAPQK
jgi:hypothetical protein